MPLLARKTLTAAFALAVGLLLILAPSAEAAKTRKHRKPVVVQKFGTMDGRFKGESRFMRGPLFSGVDYLGDDPDPFIRSQIHRDLGVRYGGND